MKFHDVVISGGTIIQNNISDEHRGNGKGFKSLKEAVVSNAFHDSGERFDPPRCHPNTRVAVIERIMDWINGEIDTDTLVLWLYGPAGAGKSAIAQTIAELCHEAGLLLATFFFSSTDPCRNNTKSLFATLAYKVMFYVPAVRPIIEQVVEVDPLIFECSLEAQFTRLILEPFACLFETGLFNQIPFPPVIIIDGLDECLDDAAQQATLAAFSKAGKQRRVPFKLLITSRPEQTIISSFKLTPLKPLTCPFQLNDDYKPDEDIRTFLVDKFDELRSTHPLGASIPPSWPSEADIDQLVAKSSGQFIYASIAIRFTSSLRHHPRDRLNIVLGLRPPRRDLPFVELDALYTQIISSSEDVGTLLNILGTAIVLAGMPATEHMAPLPAGIIDMAPLPVGIIDEILDLEEGAFQLLLADINSLVEWDDNRNRVKFHHASCPDFLLDAQRSRGLHIEPSLIYSRLVRWSLSAWKRPGMTAKEVGYIVEHFQTFCQFAAPTPELRQDLWGLALSDWASGMANLKVDFSWPFSVYPPRPVKFLLGFLFVGGLKKLAISDTAELHGHHLLLLERYITSLTLNRVSRSTIALFLLLGTGNLTTSSDWLGQIAKFRPRYTKQEWMGRSYVGPMDTFQQAIMHIFRLPHDSLVWERETIGLMASHHSRPWNPMMDFFASGYARLSIAGYEEFLLNFFRNPSRPESLHFSDHRYSELATICLQYICGRSNLGHRPDLRRQLFSRWARKFRDKPWVWRRFRQNPRLLASVRKEWKNWCRIGIRRCATWYDVYMLNDGKLVIDDEEWNSCGDFRARWSDASDQRSLHLRTFALALHLLPQLLAKSPKSDQLVDLMSRGVFHSATIFFVRRTRRAKEAIRKYLERVGHQ